MSVQKAIRVGELLTEQKEFIGHGHFLSWLEDNFDLSERTARQYMQLYRHRDKTAKIADLQEAYIQIETLERQEKMTEDERRRSLISEYRKTGKKPQGWDRSLDYIIQKDREYEKKRQERIRLEEEQREKNRIAREQERLESDLFSKSISGAVSLFVEKEQKRASWKEKIRLSASGKDDAFNDAIIDYLETLPDDNRRIEACYNIIKICKGIAVDLQKVRSA